MAIEQQEARTLETTTTFAESVDTAKAEQRLDVAESVETTATASMKKLDEKQEEIKVETAEKLIPVQESVTVSETQIAEQVEEVVEEKKTQKKAKKTVTINESVEISEIELETAVEDFKEEARVRSAKLVADVQEPISIEEVQTEGVVTELVEKKPKSRKAKVDKKAAMEERVEITEVTTQIYEEAKHAREVEEILEFVGAKQFGPGENPLRELAQIGFLVRNGVTVSEITNLYYEDYFPALKTPEAQSAMVQLVEREGHSALISEVITEETATDETLASTVGFRAFMRMVELEHATVEQVLTHFAPQDFSPHAWETTEATQVIISNSHHHNLPNPIEIIMLILSLLQTRLLLKKLPRKEWKLPREKFIPKVRNRVQCLLVVVL